MFSADDMGLYLNLCCSNYNNSSSRLVVHTIGQSGVVHIIIADNQPFGSLMRVRGSPVTFVNERPSFQSIGVRKVMCHAQ